MEIHGTTSGPANFSLWLTSIETGTLPLSPEARYLNRRKQKIISRMQIEGLWVNSPPALTIRFPISWLFKIDITKHELPLQCNEGYSLGHTSISWSEAVRWACTGVLCCILPIEYCNHELPVINGRALHFNSSVAYIYLDFSTAGQILLGNIHQKSREHWNQLLLYYMHTHIQ